MATRAPDGGNRVNVDRPTLEAARAQWRWRGQARPEFALAPAHGQVSVWDFPRPPALVNEVRIVEVFAAGERIAHSVRAVTVRETASPPTWYLPAGDVEAAALRPAQGSSLCEWKGAAHYFDVRADAQWLHRAAWCYPTPFDAFASIAGWLAFYPGDLDCRVDGQRVAPQPGGLYAGWITPELVGPFKGEPGTSHW